MLKITITRKAASRVLILAGLVLIAGALALDAFRYPWETVFNTSQNQSSIPDPSPIVLKDEDKNSIVVEKNYEAPTESLVEEEPEETAVLPGNESAELSPLPVYVELGILKIPKLKISEYILEGTQRQLRYGVGHVDNTADIGMKGNCVLAGHRSTVFRYLDKLALDDSVILKVNENAYTYSVYETFIVPRDKTWVLADIQGEEYALSLITCTPYITYSHRLIVRARLTALNGMPLEAP